MEKFTTQLTNPNPNRNPNPNPKIGGWWTSPSERKCVILQQDPKRRGVTLKFIMSPTNARTDAYNIYLNKLYSMNIEMIM